MSNVQDVLDGVHALLRNVKPQQAEDELTSLLDVMAPSELRVWEADIRACIGQFLPKRRRLLTERVGQALARRDTFPPAIPQASAPAKAPEQKLIRRLAEFEVRLDELSQRHIFQWNTQYLEAITGFSEQFMSQAMQLQRIDTTFYQRLAGAVSEHTTDVFSRHFRHVARLDKVDVSLSKSVGGLQRFLDLPLEFHSTKLTRSMKPVESRALRSLTSTMISSIIEGYSLATLGEQGGAEVLETNMSLWLHTLPFVDGKDFDRVAATFKAGEVKSSLDRGMRPFAEVLDNLTASTPDYPPLPTISQYQHPERRIECLLNSSPASADKNPVKLIWYLEADELETYMLDAALRTGVTALVAPLAAEQLKYVADTPELDPILVRTDSDVGHDGIRSRLEHILELAVFRERTPRTTNQPLQYNFAADFPLTSPRLVRYYHVDRPSVRNLLKTFESRSGVRLWCSVRRSGKTTAGLDLGDTTGRSTVITQTCDDTGQFKNGATLYNAVWSAMDNPASRLPTDFVKSTLQRCVESGDVDPSKRIVLVLDEYETLFGALASALRADERLRYTVVQPLLNQLVEFSQDNLIIFLGQQPTAHHIIMDQNQLSPYVVQDDFPLFAHGTNINDEFSELLRRILTNRVQFDRSFSDRVFLETSGHPFLTANLMVELVDWLIYRGRAANDLSLDANDFSAFAASRLRRKHLAVSDRYRFFRDGAAGQALSSTSKEATPWLFAVYSCLRAMAIESPESFSVSRTEFVEICTNLRLEELGFSPDYILSSASQANFIWFGERAVAPSVRLLARLAAVAPVQVQGVM